MKNEQNYYIPITRLDILLLFCQLWYRFKESTVLREKMDAIIEAQEIH